MKQRLPPLFPEEVQGYPWFRRYALAGPSVSQQRLDFRIYFRLPEGLLSFFKLERKPSGLYGSSTLKAAGLPGVDSHFSYHEDGTCFLHSGGKRLKGRRQPLSSFRGIGTIYYSHFSILESPPRQRLIQEDELLADDILLERGREFAMEIVMSDRLISLPVVENRPNSSVYVKDRVHPILLIEVFDAHDRTLRPERYPYPAAYDWSPLFELEDYGRRT